MYLIILSSISLLLVIIGLYLLGEKKKSAFIVFIIGLLCQLYIFYNNYQWFLLIQSIIFIIFNLINYRKWNK